MSFKRRLASFLFTYYLLFCLFSIIPSGAPAQAQEILPTRVSRLNVPATGRAQVIIEKRGGTVSKTLIMQDYLSSTKVLVSEDGQIIDYPSHYPYGTEMTSLDLSKTNQYFTGQRKALEESSVYNYRARYYNADTGLFVQPDTVEGPARFSYVGGNPAMKNDPTGHEGCDYGDPYLLDAICKVFSKFTSGDEESEPPELFMGEEGLGAVGEMVATIESVSGFGGIVAWIGDKLGGGAGSSTIDSAYASLSGGTAAGVIAMGMVQPDPSDLGRAARVAKVAGAKSTSKVFQAMTHGAAPLEEVVAVGLKKPSGNLHFSSLDDAISSIQGVLERASGSRVEVKGIAAIDYILELMENGKLRAGYKGLANDIEVMGKLDPAKAKNLEELTVAHRFVDEDGNILGELYGFHNKPEEIIEGAQRGSPWNFRLNQDGRNVRFDTELDHMTIPEPIVDLYRSRKEMPNLHKPN